MIVHWHLNAVFLLHICVLLCVYKYTRKFQKIRQQHVWHDIVSWGCRFKHVISTCRLCHCTAISGYHKYVRLKMDGLLEPWQTEAWSVFWILCVMCVARVKIHCQLVKVYWNMCNTMKAGRYRAWLSTVAGHFGTKHFHYRWCVAYRRVQLLTSPEC